ncbi:MAG: TonB-dependent receptor [Gammaproteobacteria bacterium]|nr:TonB-dependent receptor [Gammaproteobacteria bacterium]MDH3465874.1 TonB-dependent receptor [Gammaproteobacteria bacterium]
MKTNWLRLGLTAFVFTLFTAAAQAQDTRVQELERNLHERDKVITELLERVEALERRVGVQRAASDFTAAPEQNAVPTAETDPTPGSDQAPGVVFVEEGDAERALERSLTRAGALLLPSGVLDIEPRFSYTRQEATAPSLVTAGSDLFAGETELNADNLTAGLALRLGLPWDSQLEIGLPYRWREVESVTTVGFAPMDTSTQSGAGSGDVRVGLAKTLLREGLRRPDLIGRVTWDSDSGKTRDAGVSLGGGFHELQGSLTAIKRQDPIAFVGGLAYQHTFEEDQIQPGSTFSANFGSFIALSPETSLRLQLSAAFQDETELSGNKIDGSDRTIGAFVVGGSALLAPRTLLNLSVGIGLTDDADDFSISMSLPIRTDKRLF